MKDGRVSRRSLLFNGLLAAAGVAVLAGGIAFRMNDLHVQTVLSGSMRPLVSPGDLVVTQPVPVPSLRVDDVIVFYPPGQRTSVLHRIQTLTVVDGITAVTTKGDANTVPDDWTARLQGDTAYRMVGSIPFVGWLPQYRGWLFVAAGVLIGLTLVRGVWKEVRLHRPSPA